MGFGRGKGWDRGIRTMWGLFSYKGNMGFGEGKRWDRGLVGRGQVQIRGFGLCGAYKI